MIFQSIWKIGYLQKKSRLYDMPTLELENTCHILDREKHIAPSYVAGCDEAGRGAFAGPLVAAAVILPSNVNLPQITDSKQIAKKKHQQYAQDILDQALAVGVGIASVEYIDRFGVGMANRYAIEQAVADLAIKPTHLLIDGAGQQVIKSDIPQQQIVKGDSRSLSIASASIIAKSIHDALMKEYAQQYPQYKWLTNTGYGTQDHIQAIYEHGICKYHRTSIKPIKEYLKQKKKGSV